MIILSGYIWHHHDQVRTWYHYSIYRLWSQNFWWRQRLGYSDVTCSLSTENKLWHHPIFVRCMTSSAVIYATQKVNYIHKKPVPLSTTFVGSIRIALSQSRSYWLLTFINSVLSTIFRYINLNWIAHNGRFHTKDRWSVWDGWSIFKIGQNCRKNRCLKSGGLSIRN